MKKTLKWMMVGCLFAMGAQAGTVWNETFSALLAWDDEFTPVSMWDDDFSGALSSNWTVFTQGAGASVTHTNSTMVLDTGGPNTTRQAAVSTTTDETGTVSNFNGAALYNFYDHQVSTRFDIASITGSNATKRNVFYFSIGDDAGGNYMPMDGVIDDGIGFVIEQVTASPYWRIMYTTSDGGVGTGSVVANLSGVPSAITYTLHGTDATIQMEGATITAVGSAGSGTVGGSNLTATVADFSANISGYTLAYGAYNRGDVAEQTVVTLDNVSVGVGGGLNENWTVKENGSGASVSQPGTTMVLDTGDTGGGRQAVVSTTTDETGTMSTYNGEKLYNFYKHPVQARFDIDSFTGGATPGRSVFFCSIGYDSDGNYMPQSTLLDDGISFVIERTSGAPYWRLMRTKMVSGAETSDALGTLNGYPTAITYAMDGTNVTITIEGTTFGFVPPANATQISSTQIQTTVDDISANLTEYVLAYGAHNRGMVSTGTVVAVDAFSVEIDGGLNENWAAYTAGAGAGSTQTGGQLVMDTGVAAGSARAGLFTASDETGAVTTFNGAQLYDFYDHLVKARFEIDSIDGVSPEGNKRNVFYCTIGEDASDNYLAQNTVLDDGICVSLEQLNVTTSNEYWRFTIVASQGSSTIEGGWAADISGVPTAIDLTFNGGQVVVEMEGAVVTVPGDEIGESVTNGTTIVANFTNDLSSAIGTYNLAYAAHNRATVTEKTVVTLNALNISVETQTYTTWAESWGVDIGSETNDYDGDYVDNLGEYGLGGDPTDPADKGMYSTSVDGSDMVYVHALHSSDPNLVYWLETTDNLVHPNWTNIGYTVVNTNVTGETYDHVTNTVSTTADDQTFIRLRIQNN